MVEAALNTIGDNLESVALSCHKISPARYILVDSAGCFKEVSRERFEYNSKYCCWDYYSQVISINKVIASKLITSNNYLSFFIRDFSKLKIEDIEKYYSKFDIPEDRKWIPEWIAQNIFNFGNGKKADMVKFFFQGTLEEYREAGMDYLYNKSITSDKRYYQDPDAGAPLGIGLNAKKPYIHSRGRQTFGVDRDQGIRYKMFYDILKSLCKRGYPMLYVRDNGELVPMDPRDQESQFVPQSMLFVSKINQRGELEIINMDIVP